MTLSGENFTRWSRIFVNGEKVPTFYINGSKLRMYAGDIEDGDTVVVNQMGSSDTVFRSTQEYIYVNPDVNGTENELILE